MSGKEKIIKTFGAVHCAEYGCKQILGFFPPDTCTDKYYDLELYCYECGHKLSKKMKGGANGKD